MPTVGIERLEKEDEGRVGREVLETRGGVGTKGMGESIKGET